MDKVFCEHCKYFSKLKKIEKGNMINYVKYKDTGNQCTWTDYICMYNADILFDKLETPIHQVDRVVIDVGNPFKINEKNDCEFYKAKTFNFSNLIDYLK